MWVALFRALLPCEKTETQVHLVCTQINAFVKITTPDANTYCGCDSAVTYFSAMSNKGTCSTPTPKCTSDSFFSLQTPHTTEQVNKNQGRHTATAHRQRKEASCSSVATVSSALGDTAVQFSSEHSTPLP